MIATDKSLKTLRDAVAAFNRRWKAGGGELTKYTCPHCETRIEVRQPREADVGDRGFWDSMTQCTSCGELLFLKVYPNGHTDAGRPHC